MALQLRLGTLTPSISAQLDEQGIRYDEAEAEQWEKWASAIANMSMRGMIADSERQRIIKRLFKLIQARLEHHSRKLRVEASGHADRPEEQRRHQ